LARQGGRCTGLFETQRPSSAEAAALNDKKFRQTNIAAAVCYNDWFGDVIYP
jgi:hypothetical protein